MGPWLRIRDRATPSSSRDALLHLRFGIGQPPPCTVDLPSGPPVAEAVALPLIHRPLSIVSNGRRHTLTSPLIPKSALPLAPPPRSDTTAARPATALQRHRCQADPQLGQARPAHRGSRDHTLVQPIAGKGFRLFITTHQHPLLGPHQTKH
jgi:hypothetical protein